jgi:lipopolysaccharide/colanic/teichoic acid biosynthesis glycosyltransferase
VTTVTLQPESPKTADVDTMPTIWGLTPIELHDRFWKSRGVHVVRQGDALHPAERSELYLLTPADRLVIFTLVEMVDLLCWVRPQLQLVRLHEKQMTPYRERVITNDDGGFQRFQRTYPQELMRSTIVALTTDRAVAERWRILSEPMSIRRWMKRDLDESRAVSHSIAGRAYDAADGPELSRFVHELASVWDQPDSSIRSIHRVGDRGWRHDSSAIASDANLIDTAWVGAGREVTPDVSVVGPAVLWDLPEARPQADVVKDEELEPSRPFARPVRPRRRSTAGRVAKRTFDLVFSLGALVFTLPIYPLVMLAIWIEDGRPFFFAHRRESMGGKEFPCIKFRTMYNNSDEIKAKILAENRADGPQFFLDPDLDPRVTKVGRFLRKTQIDEFPQFINVLLGHMSVVGPRPSPYAENQCSPEWREARLSVRPGITGLWQVRRTRDEGCDFQEWIRYDLAYVQHATWRTDIKIIALTILKILPGKD